jgi:hypothetical protein
MAANDLVTYGVAVLPVMDEASRVWWEGLLFEAMDTFPEYKMHGRDVQRVLGGFGALGNPSSFHDPTIRQFRRKIKDLAVKPLMREFAERFFGRKEASTINIEALFDRICVRKDDFKSPTAEAWHRDIYDADTYKLRPLPHSLPQGEQDLLFGGWTNMDYRPQKFVALLGEHNLTGDEHATVGGFSTFTADQIKRFGFNERLLQQANKRFGATLQTDDEGNVVVPPGSALIFFQRIVHSVKSGPQPLTPALRVFHGFRLTTETVSLFDIAAAIENGGVPRIPSGQIPPMYSKNHYAAFNNESEPRWREWGKRVFKDECLFKRTTTNTKRTYYTPGSQGDLNKAANKGRFMPSLSEMGLWGARFEYSPDERRALTPERLFPV